MITLKNQGNYNKVTRYLEKLNRKTRINILNKYGEIGVDLLSKATPFDSGNTASSWYYEVIKKQKQYQLIFKNSHVNDGVPIAIILQYGHATRNGTWVEGINYINPAIDILFKNLADEIWKEVTRV